MEKFTIGSISALIGIPLSFLFGAWDITIKVLLTFIILDQLTGIIKGYILKELSSSVGFKGILKKSLIFVVIILGVCVDRVLGNTTFIFRTLVITFYIGVEGLSILENLSQMGLPIPEKLKKALLQVQSNKNNKDGEDDVSSDTSSIN